MGVFKVWLGVALALAEFAVLPHHSEGETAVVCVCDHAFSNTQWVYGIVGRMEVFLGMGGWKWK